MHQGWFYSTTFWRQVPSPHARTYTDKELYLHMHKCIQIKTKERYLPMHKQIQIKNDIFTCINIYRYTAQCLFLPVMFYLYCHHRPQSSHTGNVHFLSEKIKRKLYMWRKPGIAWKRHFSQIKASGSTNIHIISSRIHYLCHYLLNHI